MIKKASLAALAIWVLISCESPIQAGLGQKVDITPPVILVQSPEPGAFITKTTTFKVIAHDDIQVSNVWVYAAPVKEYNPAKASSAEWHPLQSPGANSEVWTWSKETTEYDDGLFKVRFRVADSDKKITETEDLAYTIKNLPPKIDLQIPAFIIANRTGLSDVEKAAVQKGLNIDTGTHLIGFASDIKGIKVGYPKIQFWKEGDKDPAKEPEYEPEGNWKPLDRSGMDGTVLMGFEFRYYMNQHDQRDSSEWPPLEVGNYRLRLLVKDVDGLSFAFPPPYELEGKTYDYLPIKVNPSLEQPKLKMGRPSEDEQEPDKLIALEPYQNKSFVIKAKATHTLGIERVEFKAKRQGDADTQDLEWKTDLPDYDDSDDNGPTKSRTVTSFPLTPGGSYPKKDGTSFVIANGTYEFELIAYAATGSSVSLSVPVYIDNTPPTVAITNIDPADPLDTAGEDAAHNILEARTVNGKVTINISAFDVNGIGIEGTPSANVPEIRRVRYLLVDKRSLSIDKILPLVDPSKAFNKDSNPLSADTIYKNSSPSAAAGTVAGTEPRQWAGFVDDLGKDNRNILSSPSVDTLLLNTAAIFPGMNDKGDLYLFIAAQDKAGNTAALAKGSAVTGYHLHVDQSGDKPTVKLTDLRADIHDRDSLPGTDNVMGLNARLRGTLLDDDGIIVTNDTVQFFLNKWDEGGENGKGGWAKGGGGSVDWRQLDLTADLLGKRGRSIDFAFTRSDLGKPYPGGQSLPDGIYRLSVFLKDAGSGGSAADDLKSGDLSVEGGILRTAAVSFAINDAGPRFVKTTPDAESFVSEQTPFSVTIAAASSPLHLEIVTPQSFGEADALRFWDLDYLRQVKAKNLTAASSLAEFFDPPLITAEGLNKKLRDAGLSESATPAQREQKLAEFKAVLVTKVLPYIQSISEPDLSFDSSGNRTATWKFDLRFDEDHTTILLRAQDFFLSPMDNRILYRFDKTPPVVEIEYPAKEGEYFTDNNTMKGVVWDPSKADETTRAQANGAVKNVYYWISPPSKPTQSPPAFSETSADWKPVTSSGLDRSLVNWTVPINGADAAMGEGEYTIHFVALDQAGNRSNTSSNTLNKTSWKFGVDKTPPRITETAIAGEGSPLSAKGETDKPFTLEGRYWDSNGYKELRIKQTADRGAGSPTDLEYTQDVSSKPKWTGAEGSKTPWSMANLPWKEKNTNGSMASYTENEWKKHDADGLYTYTITIVDTAGRETYVTRELFFDTAPPEITLTLPTTSLLPGGQLALFSSKSLSFMGSAYDAFPGSVTKIYYYDCELVLKDGKWEPKTQPVPLNANSDTPPYNAPPYKGVWETSGVTGTGVWRIEKKLADNAAEGERGLMVLAVDSLGHQSVQLAFLNPNNQEEKSAFFPYAYDNAPPELSETVINAGESLKTAGFNMGGTFGDTNAIASLIISQQMSGGTANEYSFELAAFDSVKKPGGYPIPLKGLNKAWDTDDLFKMIAKGDLKLPLGVSKTPPAGVAYISAVENGVTRYYSHADIGGKFTYTITAIDTAGRPTALIRQVQVDRDPPYVTLEGASPANKPSDSWYEANVNIRGLADDPGGNGASGIAQVYYWYGKKTANPPAGDSLAALKDKWRVAAGTSPWSVPLDISSSADLSDEGIYRLWVVPVDIAGNIGGLKDPSSPVAKKPPEPLEYLFNVDRAAPVVKEDPARIHSGFSKGAFNLYLAMIESYGIKSLKVDQKKDGGATETVLTQNFDPPRIGTEGSPYTRDLIGLPWSASSSSTTAVDGSYTYTITVTDLAGKTAVLTKTVFIDKTPPKVNIQSPAEGAQVTGTSEILIAGTALDAAPGSVTQVFYWVSENVSDSIPAYNPALTGTSQPWTSAYTGSAPGLINWSKSIAVGDTQGPRKIAVIAVDQLGNQSVPLGTTDPGVDTNWIGVRPFYVDREPPKMQETVLGASADRKFVNPNFTLGGTAKDSYAIDKIVLTQTWGGGTLPNGVPDSLTKTLNLNHTSQEQTWSFTGLPYSTATVGSQTGSGTGPFIFAGTNGYTGDGEFDYTITAYDVSGRTLTELRKVTLDVTPPTVTLDAAFAQNDWFLGNTIIRGTAADTDGTVHSGIGAVYYWVGLQSATVPGTDNAAGWKTTAGFESWQVGLDLNQEPFKTGGEGLYRLVVLAKDAVGNYSSAGTGADRLITYNFGIDTAPPVVKENPAHSGFAKGAFTLTLNSTDTYSLNKLLVEQGTDGGANWVKILDHALTGLTANTYPLTNLPWTSSGVPAPADDGVYTYRITLTDTAGKTAELTKTVIIDKTPPKVNIQRPAEGEQVTGTSEILIAGTASDAAPGSVTQVFYWISENVSDSIPVYNPALTGTSQPWTSAYTGNAPGLINWSKSIAVGDTQGPRKIAVIAVDQLGTQSVPLGTTDPGVDTNWIGVRPFYVDREPPTMQETVLGPSAGRKFVNPNFTLGGTAKDSYAIDKIVLTQTWAGGTLPNGVPDSLTKTLNLNHTSQEQTWSFTGLPYSTATVGSQTGSGTGPYIFAGTNGYTGDGEFDYTITAYDVSGRTLTELRKVTLDVTPPTVTLDAAFSQNAWFPGNTIIRGTAADTGGTVHSGIGAVYYWVGLQTATVPGTTFTGFNAADWKTPSGFESWQVGLDLNQEPFKTGGEGLYRLVVLAKDAVGNYSSAGTGADRLITYNFGIDTAPPVVKEDPVHSGFDKTNFTLSLKMIESYGIKSLKVDQKKDGAATETILTQNFDPPRIGTEGSPYTRDLTGLPRAAADTSGDLGASITNPADGSYLYTISVTDLAGKTAELTKTVFIDKTPPKVNIQSPAEGEQVTGTSEILIAGTASDAAPGSVTQVFYWISENVSDSIPAYNPALTGTSQPWTSAYTGSAPGLINWSKSIAVGDTQGPRKIAVIAVDQLGNQSVPLSTTDPGVDTNWIGVRPFYVDREPPKMQETVLGASADRKFVNPNFTLGGTAKDSYAIDKIVLTQTWGGGTLPNGVPDSLTKTLNLNHTSQEQTWSFTGLPYSTATVGSQTGSGTGPFIFAGTNGYTGDGEFDYTITAYDVSGRTLTELRKVTLDVTPPTVTLDAAFSQNDWFLGNTIIRGTAADTDGTVHSGIGAVYYWVGLQSATVPGTDNAAGWKTTAGFESWQVGLDLNQEPFKTGGEGLYRLVVLAKDAVGNYSSAGTGANRLINYCFGIDLEDPELTETVINVGESLKAAGFPMGGMFGDTIAMASLVIRQQVSGDTDSDHDGLLDHFFELAAFDSVKKPNGYPLPLKGLNKAWDTDDLFKMTANGDLKLPLKVSKTIPPTGVAYISAVENGVTLYYSHADMGGKFTYTITATDTAGRETSLTRQVQVDLKPPYVTLEGASPANQPSDSWYNANVNIRGLAGDPNSNGSSGIAQVYYWYGKTAIPPAWDSLAALKNSDWSIAAGTSQWSVPLDLSAESFEEGRYHLFVVPADNAGNVGGLKDPLFDAAKTPREPLEYLFNVDRAAPRLVENPVHSGFSKTNFTLSLKMIESYGIKSLKVDQKKDGDSSVTILNTNFAASPPTTGTEGSPYSYPLTGLPWSASGASISPADGSYTYTITVTDLADKTVVLTKTVLIDKTPPTVNIRSPAQGEQVTGTSEILIAGTALDATPGSVTQVFYWLGVGDVTPPTYPAGTWTSAYTGSAPGLINWSKSIAVGDTQGPRKIAVIAVDQLGNQSVPLSTADPGVDTNWIGVRPFYVDREPPTMTETALGPSAGRKYVKPNFTLGGTAKDSYAIDKIVLTQTWAGSGSLPAGVLSSVTVTLNLNSSLPTYGSQQQLWSFTGLPYKDNSGTSTGTAADTTFSFTGTNNYAGDGEFNYEITAYDVSGRTIQELRNVTLDTTAPTVTLDTVFTQNRWFNGNASLSGTASDAGGTIHSGLKAVYYWIGRTDGSTPDTLPVTTSAGFNATQWKTTSGFDEWQVPLDITKPPFSDKGQGLYTLLVLAVDAVDNISLNSTEADAWNGKRLITYPFGVDWELPGVPTETTQGSDKYQYGAFSLGGGFTDSYALSTYQITQQALSGGGPRIIKSYGTEYDALALTTANSQTWSISNLPRDLTNTANLMNPLTDDEYTYVITVRDRSGKETSFTRVITLDNAPPTAAISEPIAGSFVTNPAQVKIEGTANDTAPGKVDKAYYWIGKYSGTTAPAIPNPFTGGTGYDGIGTPTNGWAEADLAALTGSWTWSKTVDLSVTGEGQYLLAVIARDKAGRLSAANAGALATRSFWVDTAEPNLAETEFTQENPPVRNAEFTLKGTAWDTNGLKSVTITQQKTGLSTDDTILPAITFSGGNGLSSSTVANWALGGANLPRGIGAGNNTTLDLQDGIYTYTITLTDKAGRTATVQRVINVDKTAPRTTGDVSDITVEAPLLPVESVYNWQSGATMTVRGTVKDADPTPNPPGSAISPSGIKRVFYVAAASGAVEPAAGWQNATLQGNAWEGPLNLAGLPEGVNKLWVRAEDYAGNISAAYTRLFGVDNNPPSITAVVPDGHFNPTPAPGSEDVQYSEGARFTLNGAATDGNQVVKVVVTQQWNPTAGAPGAVVPIKEFPINAATGTWDLGADYLPRNPADITKEFDISSLDGVFVYTITAHDIANKATSIIRRIAIDTAGPTLGITVPENSGKYQGDTMQISGWAMDSHGVQKVKYLILSGTDASADAAGQKAGYISAANTAVPAAYAAWADAEGGAAWEKTIKFASLSPSITEGRIRLWAVAQDKSTLWGDPVNADFDLDQNPPVINNFAFNPTNMTFTTSTNYARGDFSFTFDAADSNKLLGTNKLDPWTLGTPSAVKIERYNGATTTTLTASSSNGITIANGSVPGDSVRVTVNQMVSGLSDGAYTYTMTITDVVGKTVVLEKTVVVDTVKPEVFVTNLSPIVDEDSVNGIISFSITASDDSGVQGVKYAMVPGNPGTAPVNYDAASLSAAKPAAPFTFSFDTTTLTAPAMGDYTLYAVTRDRAGNDTVSAGKKIRVDQDTDKPRIQLLNLTAYKSPADPANPTSVDTRPGFEVLGLIADDDGVDISQLKVFYSSNNSSWTQIANGITHALVADPSTKEYTFKFIIKKGVVPDLADGVWYLKADVKDDASKKNGKPAVDGTTTAIFKIDTNPPVLALGSAFTSGVQTFKAAPSLTGTLAEANLANLQVSLDGGGYTNYVTSGATGLILGGTAPNYTWTYRMTDEAFAALEEGPHSVMLEAVDQVGGHDTKGWTFFKDNAGPEINFSNITEEGFVIIQDGASLVQPANETALSTLKNSAAIITDNIPRLMGTFTDEYSNIFESSNQHFYYRFDSGQGSTDATTGWSESAADMIKTALPSKNVRWEIPLGNPGANLAQGIHWVDIRLTDSLGNINTSVKTGTTGPKWSFERVAFRIDSQPPEVSIASPADGSVFSAPGTGATIFSFKANVSDYTLASIEVKVGTYTLYSQTKAQLAGATAMNIDTPFTQTMLASLGGGGSYAVYPITISAVDDNGRETKLEYHFTMDAAPPLITVSNLDTTKTPSDTYPTRLIEAAPKIQGSVSDDSGLSSAQYQIAKFTYSGSGTAGTWGTVGAWTNLKAGPLSNLETWSIDLKGPTASGGRNLSDGLYRVSFKVVDKAQPTNNVNTTLTEIAFYIDGSSPVLQLVSPKAYYSGKEESAGGVDYIVFNIIATDNNMISSVRGKLDSNVFSSGAITAAAINGAPAGQPNFKLRIPAFNPAQQIADALHTLNLEAVDGSGRTTTITKDFTFDSKKPSVEIIEPGDRAEVTAQVILRGVTSDDNSVKTLSYQLANGAWHLFDRGLNAAGSEVVSGAYTDEDNPSLGKKKDLVQGRGSLYNWTLRFPDIGDLIKLANSADYVTALGAPNGGLYELLVKFRVEDSAGNQADYTHTLWINPEGDRPRVIIDTPDPTATGTGREVGGEVRVFGTAIDNDWIYEVAFRVIDAASDDAGTAAAVAIPGAALHPAANAAAAAKGEAANRRLWYKAAISGANASQVSWYFTINSSGELNPASGTNSRPVTIQVIAYDSSQANHNAPKLESQVKPTYATFVNGMPKISNIKITPAGGAAADYTTANPNLGGEFTITATMRDDNGLASINWHNESNPSWSPDILQTTVSGTPPARYARPAPTHLKTPDQVVTGKWYFLYATGSNYEGTNTAGQTITASVTGALFKASGARTGSGGYVLEAVNDDGTLFTNASGKTAYWEYELSITENAQTLLGGVERARNYIYSLQAVDNTSPNPFRAVLDLTLKLDYYHPWGGYTGNGTAAGTGYVLSGEAWDTGSGITVQGIQKIVAWFSRDSKNIPINELGGGSYKTGAKIRAMVGRNETSGALGTLTEITLPDLTLGKNDLNLSGIVIDNNEPVNDIDNDGFLEGLVDAGLRMQWYAYLDSTKFIDGMAKVHFVIFDKAGNASYYENNLFFSNHPPTVTRVIIATDILGFGSSDDPRGQRTITLGYDKTNITVRNRKLDFKVHIEGQAEPFHYRFGFVNARPVVNANALVAGEIYAIKEPGNVAWTAVGAPQEFGVNTTFVALGPTNVGTGTAYKLEMGLPRYENTNDKDVTFSYSGNDFNTITDAANNDAWFVLKVYNSLRTPIKPDNGASGPAYNNAGPYEVLDQPFDVIRIGLNVANTDITAPRAKLWDLNPKGETRGADTAGQPGGIGDNLNKGGLYNPNNNIRNVVRSGHIEPRFASGNNSSFIESGRNTNFTKDTLSGKVILRGIALDEQRIGEVWLKIGNDAAFKILEAETNSAAANAGLLKPSVTGAYVFNEIDLDSHRAEWAYVWDTETKPANTVVNDGVNVEVFVKDRGPTPNTSPTRNHPNTSGTGSGSSTAAGTNDGYSSLPITADSSAAQGYNRISVALRPYISGFARDGTKGYSTLRSKQGWYTFSRGETVSMTGWNLKTPADASTLVFDTDTATTAVATTATGSSKLSFTVPTTAVTGAITLKAGPSGALVSVNDTNNNANSWNTEDYNPANLGNELWKDDRKAHIWQSDGNQGHDKADGYFYNSTRPIDPSMTMDPSTGTLFGAWSEPSSQSIFYGSTSNATRNTVLTYSGGGTMDHTDIYYAASKRSTNPNYPAVIYNSTRAYAGTIDRDGGGGIKLYDPNGGGKFDEASSGLAQYNAELVYHDGIIDQFTNPRIITFGNDIHAAYYDTKDRSMKYWYTKSGHAPSSTEYNSNRAAGYTYASVTMKSQRWVNLDGGSDTLDAANDASRVRNTGLARVTKDGGGAGEWSAIAVQTNGNPVVAYYDAQHQTVRLAYANKTNPLSGNDWTVMYAMAGSDPNYQFSGQYISLAIDAGNNAHLAFFRSYSTDLVYLKLSWSGGAYTTAPSVIVDNTGSVGRWTDISLDTNQRPWISYFDITKMDQFDGIKMAYYNPAKFPDAVLDDNNQPQTGWEAMNVPALWKTLESRIGVETWPSRESPANPPALFWGAAIGYKAEDYFRIAYYVKPKN